MNLSKSFSIFLIILLALGILIDEINGGKRRSRKRKNRRNRKNRQRKQNSDSGGSSGRGKAAPIDIPEVSNRYGTVKQDPKYSEHAGGGPPKKRLSLEKKHGDEMIGVVGDYKAETLSKEAHRLYGREEGNLRDKEWKRTSQAPYSREMVKGKHKKLSQSNNVSHRQDDDRDIKYGGSYKQRSQNNRHKNYKGNHVKQSLRGDERKSGREESNGRDKFRNNNRHRQQEENEDEEKNGGRHRKKEHNEEDDEDNNNKHGDSYRRKDKQKDETKNLSEKYRQKLKAKYRQKLKEDQIYMGTHRKELKEFSKTHDDMIKTRIRGRHKSGVDRFSQVIVREPEKVTRYKPSDVLILYNIHKSVIEEHKEGFPTEFSLDDYIPYAVGEEVKKEKYQDWMEWFNIKWESCVDKNHPDVCLWDKLELLYDRMSSQATRNFLKSQWFTSYIFFICQQTPYEFCPDLCRSHTCHDKLYSTGVCFNIKGTVIEGTNGCECQPLFIWSTDNLRCVRDGIGNCPASNPCNSKGTENCKSTEGGFICECKMSHMGPLCKQARDACMVGYNHPPGNELCGPGTCVPVSGTDDYGCICPDSLKDDADSRWADCNQYSPAVFTPDKYLRNESITTQSAVEDSEIQDLVMPGKSNYSHNYTIIEGQPHKHKKDKTLSVIVIAILVPLILIMIGVCLVLWMFQKQEQNKTDKSQTPDPDQSLIHDYKIYERENEFDETFESDKLYDTVYGLAGEEQQPSYGNVLTTEAAQANSTRIYQNDPMMDNTYANKPSPKQEATSLLSSRNSYENMSVLRPNYYSTPAPTQMQPVSPQRSTPGKMQTVCIEKSSHSKSKLEGLTLSKSRSGNPVPSRPIIEKPSPAKALFAGDATAIMPLNIDDLPLTNQARCRVAAVLSTTAEKLGLKPEATTPNILQMEAVTPKLLKNSVHMLPGLTQEVKKILVEKVNREVYSGYSDQAVQNMTVKLQSNAQEVQDTTVHKVITSTVPSDVMKGIKQSKITGYSVHLSTDSAAGLFLPVCGELAKNKDFSIHVDTLEQMNQSSTRNLNSSQSDTLNSTQSGNQTANASICSYTAEDYQAMDLLEEPDLQVLATNQELDHVSNPLFFDQNMVDPLPVEYIQDVNDLQNGSVQQKKNSCNSSNMKRYRFVEFMPSWEQHTSENGDDEGQAEESLSNEMYGEHKVLNHEVEQADDLIDLSENCRAQPELKQVQGQVEAQNYCQHNINVVYSNVNQQIDHDQDQMNQPNNFNYSQHRRRYTMNNQQLARPIQEELYQVKPPNFSFYSENIRMNDPGICPNHQQNEITTGLADGDGVTDAQVNSNMNYFPVLQKQEIQPKFYPGDTFKCTQENFESLGQDKQEFLYGKQIDEYAIGQTRNANTYNTEDNQVCPSHPPTGYKMNTGKKHLQAFKQHSRAVRKNTCVSMNEESQANNENHCSKDKCQFQSEPSQFYNRNKNDLPKDESCNQQARFEAEIDSTCYQCQAGNCATHGHIYKYPSLNETRNNSLYSKVGPPRQHYVPSYCNNDSDCSSILNLQPTKQKQKKSVRKFTKKEVVYTTESSDYEETTRLLVKNHTYYNYDEE